MYNIGDIVHGNRSGTFVVVGFRVIEGERWLRLRSVNPIGYEVFGAELALPPRAVHASRIGGRIDPSVLA